MSRVMKLPAALNILAATSGWPSRPIFQDDDNECDHDHEHNNDHEHHDDHEHVDDHEHDDDDDGDNNTPPSH